MSMTFNTRKRTEHNIDHAALERKTYMEMAPEKLEYVMQQAVLSRDDKELSGFCYNVR